MTTIIATRKTIWADTLCPYSVPFHFSKIVRIGNSIFAGAGMMPHVSAFMEWKRGGEKPDFPADADFDVLEINRQGIFLHDQDLHPFKIKEGFYAIGTGAEYAIGALEAGATPMEAMRIAARWDRKNTGLPIESLSL